MTIIWSKTSTGTGDVELELAYTKADVGDVFDGTFSETILSDITSVAGSAGQSYQTTFTLPISDMVPDDLLGLALFRDATGGNLDDTFASSISLIQVSLDGYFWR